MLPVLVYLLEPFLGDYIMLSLLHVSPYNKFIVGKVHFSIKRTLVRVVNGFMVSNEYSVTTNCDYGGGGKLISITIMSGKFITMAEK